MQADQAADHARITRDATRKQKDEDNMEPNEDTPTQPQLPNTTHRPSRRRRWQVAGAAVLIGGLAAGTFALNQGGQSSVANASANGGVVASQVSSQAQTTPMPGTNQGPGGRGGFGNMGGHGFGQGGMGGFGPGDMSGRFGASLTVTSVNTSTTPNTIAATGRGNQTITITVASTTTYTMAGAPIALAGIDTGAQISVQGKGTSRTAIAATSVEVILPSERGVVSDVSGSTLTVTGFDGRAYVVTVGTSTRYQKAGQSAAVSDVANGTAIQAEGTLNSDGSMSALLVTIQTPRLSGQVTAVSGTSGSYSFTIAARQGAASQTVTTTSGTLFVDLSGAAVQPSSITTGTRMTAEGSLSADGKTMTALRITILPTGNGPRGQFHRGNTAGPAATGTPGTASATGPGV